MDVIKLMEKAIETERQAQEMYREGAEAAEDLETRSIFEQLVRWEQDHERLLTERLATLKLIRGQQ